MSKKQHNRCKGEGKGGRGGGDEREEGEERGEKISIA